MTESPPSMRLAEWLREILPASPQAAATIERSIAENPGRIDRAYAELLAGYSLESR